MTSRGLARLIRSRVAVKLTLTLVGFVALILAVAGVYLNRSLEEFAVETLETRLVTTAQLLLDDARLLVLHAASPAEFHGWAASASRRTGARTTVIATDGRVLGDSEVEAGDLAALENHRERPEVRAALQGHAGHDLRTSATVHTPLFYAAVPIEDRGRIVAVLRLALPLETVTASYRALHERMLLGALLALGAAFAIGVFVAGRVTRPIVEMQRTAREMSEGQFAVRLPVRSTDEIGALGRAFNVMAVRLREKIEDLEHERAKTTAILDAMVEAVIAVDGHDAILSMNPQARAMFAVTAAGVEGKAFLEVLRNVDLHDVFREVRLGTAVHRELRLRHPVDRVLQVNAVPLPLGTSETGVLMVLHDVTAVRKLEQVRTEFVANVSHELRTPLTAIQGYLETLLGGALEEPEHARRFLEIAYRHTERLGRLVSDLTDLSNIELGKIRLDRRPIDVADVVESTLAIVRPGAESAHVVLHADVAPSVTVYGDHDRLQQILLNLVDNAVKYTPSGGSVGVTARALGASRVEIVVADTGVGIPAADVPRVTERFYRVDKARSRELGGTGLGLAIVKHLVLAHGGELAIDSQLGRGTTVRVVLPATRGDVGPEAADVIES